MLKKGIDIVVKLAEGAELYFVIVIAILSIFKN